MQIIIEEVRNNDEIDVNREDEALNEVATNDAIEAPNVIIEKPNEAPNVIVEAPNEVFEVPNVIVETPNDEAINIPNQQNENNNLRIDDNNHDVLNNDGDDFHDFTDDNDSDDDDNDFGMDANLLSIDLSVWFLEGHISHRSLSNLLRVLRVHYRNSNLPSHSRTLLATPRIRIRPRACENDESYYYGIQRYLQSCEFQFLQHIDRVELYIGWDGISLSDSSSLSIWPIIGSFVYHHRHI